MLHNRITCVLIVTIAAGACGTGYAQNASRTVPDAAADTPPAKHAPESTPDKPSLLDAQEWFIRGDYERAAEAFEALAAASPAKPDAIIGRARVFLQTGAYEKTIDWLREHPLEDSSDWHVVLAEAHHALGRYEETLQSSANAFKLNADHAGARLLQAQTLEWLGRREEAIQAYQWFERQLVEHGELKADAAWLTHCAVGFVRYTVLTRGNLPRRLEHALQNMLQEAYGRLDRTYWPARIAAGELLRERYNNDPHDGSVSDYEAALRINPNLPQAQVGLGLVALERWGFEEIEDRVAKALAVNPNFSPAFHLRARKLITERRYDEAIATSRDALEINPNDIFALSLAAAAAACQLDDVTQRSYEARVLEINPKSAILHRTLGDALGGIRQYEASESAYLKAIEFDPTDANARTDLGMMYMQWGLEAKAREALEAAWALDPFNERTKFTLELLEMIDGFERHETDNFLIRYDGSADPGIGPYIGQYLEDLYEEVTADYETPLKHKTEIEIFPTQRAFAVRITGQPWIHTVGACTGRVIAMASPRESPQLMGSYNLASVLRHEFTHTVTLAATRNRIPHWFTEGLAVYQEDSTRRFEWCELLADAIRHDRLFTIESIDWGFIRPKRPTDRQMAYAQSEWMVEYIVARFGYGTIHDLLNGYDQGQTQTELFQEILNISLDEFDRAFAQWAREQARQWRLDLSAPEDVSDLQAKVEADPDNPELHARLAKALLDEGSFDTALQTAERVLEQQPDNLRALEVAVTILHLYSRQERDRRARDAYDDRAMPWIERLMALDPDGWIGPKYLGDIMLRRNQLDRAADALERLQRNLPIDPASWRGLAGIYLKRDDEERALPQLIEFARLVDDDADVRHKIAQIYKRQGRIRDAIYWLSRALFIEPFNVELHRALGNTCLQANDPECALREYHMLTLIEPEQPAHFESAALAAQKLGRQEQAVEFAHRALKLNPESTVRSLIPGDAPTE